MTFVKWRKGGGKGYNGGSYAARAGGNTGLSGAGFGKGVTALRPAPAKERLREIVPSARARAIASRIALSLTS